MGHSGWAALHRPHLVHLLVLGSRFPQPPFRARPARHGPAAVCVYTGATVGSISGGWLSSSLLRHGWSLNRSRKTALLVCAVAVIPVVFASRTPHLWLAVGVVAIAAGAHQGWSANMYTLASDMFPRSAVGSVVGFASMAGSGRRHVRRQSGGIHPAMDRFVWVGLYHCGFGLPCAFMLVQSLAPQIRPVTVGTSQ